MTTTDNVGFSFSRGFDRGNYGHAYESQDWDSWYEEQSDKCPEELDLDAWRDGLLAGFFSSYEVSELEEELGNKLERIREKHPEVA